MVAFLKSQLIDVLRKTIFGITFFFKRAKGKGGKGSCWRERLVGFFFFWVPFTFDPHGYHNIGLTVHL